MIPGYLKLTILPQPPESARNDYKQGKQQVKLTYWLVGLVFFYYSYLCEVGAEGYMYHYACGKVREQHEGVSSLLPSCESCGSNSVERGLIAQGPASVQAWLPVDSQRLATLPFLGLTNTHARTCESVTQQAWSLKKRSNQFKM